MDISDAKKQSIAMQIINEMDNYNKMWLLHNHSSNNGDDPTNRVSAEEMDEKRQQNIAYEYLCHLEEAKKWIESCIREELPSTTELEENLRNGVYLAKLSNFFCPEKVPFKKIFDKDQNRYKQNGLQFRHTDNINHWFNAMEHIGLPKIFFPETTDIYDRKNMPRVIYCLHALSLYLFKLGIAPQIQDLYGVAKFTDEEITTMARELQKYGLQLPAFSKIGGILANELPFDEAALHAAILAINDAIEKQNFENTLASLKLHDAHLANITDSNSRYYQECMYEAKKNKSNMAKTKSTDSNYISDVYDELLTQAEIQGFINKVNVEKLIIDINECINKQDSEQLLRLLKSKISPFKCVFESNVDWYMAQLTQETESKLSANGDRNNNCVLDKDVIQNSINIANSNADERSKCSKMIDSLNTCLANDDKENFINLLNTGSNLNFLPNMLDCEYSSNFYYNEFKCIFDEKESNLDYEDFQHGINVLNAIVKINKTVDKCNKLNLNNKSDYINCTNNVILNELIDDLSNTTAHLQDINENLVIYYINTFNNCKKQKYDQQLQQQQQQQQHNGSNGTNGVHSAKSILTHFELQECISRANLQFEQEYLTLALLKDSITKDNEAHTLYIIKNFKFNNVKIINENAYLYHCELNEFAYENTNFSIENVRTVIENCNSLLYNAINMSQTIHDINRCDRADKENAIKLISDRTVNLNLNPSFMDAYYNKFIELKDFYSDCEDEIDSVEWLKNKTTDEKYDFYYNIRDQSSFSWLQPDTFTPTDKLITRRILRNAIDEATQECERFILYKEKEPLIILLQSNIRGYLTRKCLRERAVYLRQQIPHIVAIQAWWRMIVARQTYLNRLKYYKDNTNSVLLLQSYVRMWIQRRKYLERLNYFKKNEKAIVKIQSIVRATNARRDYKSLTGDKTPSLSVVRKFVHLLEHNNIDFTEEIELQELKRQVITLIKMNKNLEQDLDMMDVKIGLLVKNRITLQDVLMQHKKLKKYKEDIELNQTNHIKQLNKENHEKLELYQNLFYLLQTNPTYLAKLLFALPTTNTSKFIETIVLQLFNYGANSREEYLLLKLFTAALEEEIESRVDKISDILTGTPLVVKVIVSLYRKQKGENILRNLLHEAIEEVINDKSLQLCLNPSDIYKAWISRIEMESGKPTGYPYDVTNQKALEYDEVRKELQRNIEQVKHYTAKFEKLIISSIDKIPYGLRYIAKMLRNTLKAKFPATTDREILKIVGNLIYYRFINSAICSPDAYDIIDIKAGMALDTEERKNLACISKHLQLISMSKGYGDTENAHLSCLNPFIKESHERMRNYFHEICLVPDADEYFGINEFSDLIVLTKPVVYMTLQEIYNTHKILVENMDKIAPKPDDPLREIIKLLGDEPSLASLSDTISTNRSSLNSISNQLNDSLNNSGNSNVQICLTLTDRYTPNDDDKTDLNNLFIKTKRLIVDIIQCQSGKTLNEILETPTTKEQEELHKKLITKREVADKLMNYTNTENDRLTKTFHKSLDAIKAELRENLTELETYNLVSSKNNYQAILTRIAQDISNQRRHRIRRQHEIAHLNDIYKVLNKKNNLLKEQVSYYNEYVKACLDNYNSKTKKSRNPFKRHKEVKASEPIKYTAAKLHEKGVIISIDGLEPNQFKNVSFEIIPTNEPGVFDVNAKFMNVPMDKVELIFQDLLQLQYEGVPIMKMFDRAKVNVNLLIFLINKKFYGK